MTTTRGRVTMIHEQIVALTAARVKALSLRGCAFRETLEKGEGQAKTISRIFCRLED
jgi:hypothetical protein